jgi:hypothetical protein
VPSPIGGGSDRAARHAAISGPLEAAHRTFAVVGLVVLIADLIIITVSPRGDIHVWLEALAIASLIATGLVWYRGVRRGRYGGLDSVVDASTIFLVAFTATSIPLTAGTGLMMARASLDSLSGSLPAKLANSAVAYACLVAGLVLAETPSKIVGDGLILSGVALLVVTVLFHVFSLRLAEGERALRHELVLAAAAGELAGRADERRISEVVLAAAEDLAGKEVPAAVAVGTADRLVVTAATTDLGQAVGTFLRLDGDELRPSHSDRAAAAPAPHLPDRLWTAAMALPMLAQGTAHGVLIVDATRPIDPALRGSLESLCSSAGPALATARLTVELEAMAFHDPLTRPPNRAQLDEHTGAALERAERDGSTVGLLVLDLDGFKQNNDRFGHRAAGGGRRGPAAADARRPAPRRGPGDVPRQEPRHRLRRRGQRRLTHGPGASVPGEQRVAGGDRARGEVAQVGGVGVEGDHRADRGAAGRLDRRRVPGDDRGADLDLVALGGEQREPLAVEVDGVDAEVDEDAVVVGAGDHEGVRLELEQRPGDRRDRRRRGALGVHRHAGADHLAGEDRVGDGVEADRRPGQGRGDDSSHSSRSSMSLAMVSASGPTITCTTLPDFSTPWAPARRSAASSTRPPSLTSVRSLVMHGSISMMLSAPPSPATICSALSIALLLAATGLGANARPGAGHPGGARRRAATDRPTDAPRACPRVRHLPRGSA